MAFKRIFKGFTHEEPRVRVAFSDDGRCAYAFFSRNDRINGHVWLYNRLPAPLKIEMGNHSLRPLNAAEFVKDEHFEPVVDKDEVDLVWQNRDGVIEAGIYIRGKLHAVVGEGDWPGWCVLAAKDGPLANAY